VPSYDALANKQRQLIRKALDGSVFAAPFALPNGTPTAAIANLTAKTGTAPNEVIGLVALPAEWDDLGLLTTDGASYASDVSTSDVQSWGSVTPTRSDIVSDTTTLTVVAQETKALTVGIMAGVNAAGLTPDAATGELSIPKATRPQGLYYRLLGVAVDLGEGGEIYIARFLPRAKLSNRGEQAFGGGDDPISWNFTFTGEVDDDLGYSERWIFGGAGWNAILADMGWS
jgi:hypothetical protein